MKIMTMIPVDSFFKSIRKIRDVMVLERKIDVINLKLSTFFKTLNDELVDSIKTVLKRFER
jgi:hypothetical protein